MTSSRLHSLPILIYVILLAFPVWGAEQGLLEKYFAALRERGLYAVAEEYAVSQLTNHELPASEREVLTIELARTFVDHGTLASGASRTELWKEADEILQQGLSNGASPSQRLRIEVWKQLLWSHRARTLAFEAELQPELQSLRTEAGASLRTAVRGLKALEGSLNSVLRTAGSATGEKSISPGQLQDWLHLTQLECADSILWQAELLSPGVERTGLLLDATGQLERIQRSRSQIELARQIALLQARAVRLQGDYRQAEKILDKAATTDMAPIAADQILAERLRLELARSPVDIPLQMVVNRLRDSNPPTDEYRAIAVRVLLEAWKIAAQKQDEALQKQLLAEATSQHEQTYGRWRKQTAILLARQQQESMLGGELAELDRKANAAWQAQKIDVAIEKFGEAASLALRSELREQAFQYALTRASIQLQLERWATAEKELTELVQKFPEQPQVAQADLLKCYALGRNAPHSEEYVDALLAHLKAYPDSTTQGDVLWMLGVEAEQANVAQIAIQHYRQIPEEHARKRGADERMTLLYNRLLNSEKTQLNDQDAFEEQAKIDVQRIAQPLLTSPAMLTLPENRMLLNCAKLCLRFRNPLTHEADQILAKIQNSIIEHNATSQRDPDEVAEWKQLGLAATQLRIVSLAAQDRLEEAQKILKQYRDDDLSAMLAILAGLTELAAQMEPDRQKELGVLQRLTVQEIATRRRELTTEQQMLLEQAEAQASLAMRDWTSVIRTTDTLLDRSPKDLALLRQLIHALHQRGSPGDLELTKDAWLKIEQLEKKGSRNWLEARLNIAAILAETGETSEARKLLGVTRTLYPQMGTPELKARADELWESLRNQK